MTTDKERLDFIEKNPSLFGLKPDYTWHVIDKDQDVNNPATWNEWNEFIDLRSRIDDKIKKGYKNEQKKNGHIYL